MGLPARSVLRWSQEEALENLRAPDAAGRMVAAGFPAVLMVEDAARAESEPDIEAVAAALRELPCVTVAVGDRVSVRSDEPVRDPWLSTFDVVLTDRQAPFRLVERVLRSPIAATTLVGLLRAGEGLSVPQAVHHESLAYSMLQAGPEFAQWLDTRKELEAGGDVGELPQHPVSVSRKDARLSVVLDRPHKRNAVSVAMREALLDAFGLAIHDDTVSEIVVTGAGPDFCAGGDLTEFGTSNDPATAHLVRITRHIGLTVSRLRSRVRFEVHGACVGAGIEIPAFANRIEARRDALFQLPEVAMGLIPGAGGTASIPRRIGRQRTAWLALSGETIDADQALAWGLVDALVD